MSLEIGKKYFGILHLNIIHDSTPNGTPICLHTKYGNLYIIRRHTGCSLCIGDITNCIDNDNVHCSCSLIKKYSKQNKKVLTHFLNDRINEFNKKHPGTDWSSHFNYKLKTHLDSAI